MPTITFEPSGKRLTVTRGTSVLIAAVMANETAVVCCGITPVCGHCVLDVLEGESNLTPPDLLEADYRTRHRLPPYRRLGCMAQVVGDVQVELAR